MILERQDARTGALAGFIKCRDIIVKLREKSPDDAQLPKDLDWFEERITGLKR